MSDMRRDLNAKILQKQQVADDLEMKSSLLSSSLTSLKKSLEEKSLNNEALMNMNLELKSKLEEKEEAFKKEMSAQLKLSDLYRSSLEEVREKIIQFEEDKRSLVSSFEAEREKLVKELDEKSLRINELELMLRKNEEEVNMLKSLTDALSPTASFASQLKKSGRSLTEVITENRSLRSELCASQKECQRLTSCLEQVCQDIEDKSLDLQTERQEMENQKSAMIELASDFEKLVASNNITLTELAQLKQEHEELEKSRKALDRQNKDLARQVSVLLAQLEGVVPSMLDDNDATPLDDSVASQDIISSQLVTFKDIQELQARNHQLLGLVRTLTDNQETLEKEREELVESAIHEKLEAVKRELISLKKERIEEVELVGNLVSQRDLLKKVLEVHLLEGDGVFQFREDLVQLGLSDLVLLVESRDLSSSAGDLRFAELKIKFEKYVKDQQAREAELTAKCKELSEKSSAAVMESARSLNQILFLEERTSHFERMLQSKEADLKFTREKYDDVTKVLSSCQSQNIELAEELKKTMIKELSLKSETEIIRSQLATLKESFDKLMKEQAVVLEDRERLSSSLKGIESALHEQENSEKNRLKALQDQYSSLEADYMALQQSQRETMKALKIEEYKSEKLNREHSRVVESLNYENSREKTLLAQKDAQLEELNNQLVESKQRIKDNEKRLDILLSLKNSGIRDFGDGTGHSSPLGGPNTPVRTPSSGAALLDKYMTVQKSLDSLTAEKNELLAEVARLQAQIESRNLEASSTQAELLEKSSLVDTLNSTLVAKNEELKLLEDRLQTLSEAVAEERLKFQTTITHYQSLERQYLSQQSSLKDDITSLKDENDKILLQYQNSVREHAKLIETLQVKSSEVESITLRLVAKENETNTLNTSVSTLQSELEAVRANAEKQLIAHQCRESELEEQNSLLLGKLDVISGLDAASENAPDAQLIHLLTKEKERLSLERDTLNLERTRLVGQIEELENKVSSTSASLETSESLVADLRNKLSNSVLLSSVSEKLNQLDLLQESNAHLRQESKNLLEKVHTLEAENRKIMEEKYLPSREQLLQATATIRMLEAEKSDLVREIDSWKERYENLLSVNETETKAQHQSELKEAQELLEQRDADIRSLQGSVESWKAKSEAYLKRLRELKDKYTLDRQNLIAEKEVLEKQLASASAQRDEHQQASEHEFQERISGLLSQVEEKDLAIARYSNAVKNLTKQKADIIENHSTETESLHGKISVLEDELAGLKSGAGLKRRKGSAVDDTIRSKRKKSTSNSSESETVPLDDESNIGSKIILSDDGETTANFVREYMHEDEFDNPPEDERSFDASAGARDISSDVEDMPQLHVGSNGEPDNVIHVPSLEEASAEVEGTPYSGPMDMNLAMLQEESDGELEEDHELGEEGEDMSGEEDGSWEPRDHTVMENPPSEADHSVTVDQSHDEGSDSGEYSEEKQALRRKEEQLREMLLNKITKKPESPVPAEEPGDEPLERPEVKKKVFARITPPAPPPTQTTSSTKGITTESVLAKPLNPRAKPFVPHTSTTETSPVGQSSVEAPSLSGDQPTTTRTFKKQSVLGSARRNVPGSFRGSKKAGTKKS